MMVLSAARHMILVVISVMYKYTTDVQIRSTLYLYETAQIGVFRSIHVHEL